MFKNIAMIGALLSGAVVTPAYAQYLSPPGTSFSATGLVQFDKVSPAISVTCNLTLTGSTDAAVDSPPTKTATATITGGTNTGAGCTTLTVDGGTASYDSGTGDWVFSTVVRSSGTPICGGPVHFTVDSGDIIFDSDIAPDCHALGVLTSSPTINNVP